MSDLFDAPRLRPVLARPRGFRLARAAFRGLQRVTRPARRRYYLSGTGQRCRRRHAGERARRRWAGGSLSDRQPPARDRRRTAAQKGFLHVDIDPGAHHLEWVAPAWRLPLPDGWASEIVAVHALEHVEPSRLVETLQEWRRVLRPDGRVQVHVPNGPALMRAFVSRPVPEKWPIMGSILGMYCSPAVRDPGGLVLRSYHQLIFDVPLLHWALEAAGFTALRDLTGVIEDRHAAPWRDLVADYSLIAEARKPLERDP